MNPTIYGVIFAGWLGRHFAGQPASPGRTLRVFI
jgi:hypothetical protein